MDIAVSYSDMQPIGPTSYVILAVLVVVRWGLLTLVLELLVFLCVCVWPLARGCQRHRGTRLVARHGRQLRLLQVPSLQRHMGPFKLLCSMALLLMAVL